MFVHMNTFILITAFRTDAHVIIFPWEKQVIPSVMLPDNVFMQKNGEVYRCEWGVWKAQYSETWHQSSATEYWLHNHLF